MKKLLITGASGFLGWHLCELSKPSWEVYGVVRTRSCASNGITLLHLDLTDFQAMRQVFHSVQPDAVIHAAAQANVNLCQTQPNASYAINVTASLNLAGLCSDRDIPCAFTSTDLVFDGKHPPYREIDPVCPINTYGEQKVAAEDGMLRRHIGVVICRMPLMFGAAPTAPSFLQSFLHTLQRGESLKLFTDEYRTPASGKTAATGILIALERAKGLLHLGGRERLSRYEFGQIMAEIFGFPQSQLIPCRQADVPMPAARPADVSLESIPAFGLGYQPRLIREELTALREGGEMRG
jgi:dTDP-4-dehydrorhamnose reductase